MHTFYEDKNVQLSVFCFPFGIFCFPPTEGFIKDGELTEAEADLSHRVGQFMQRAAIPFLALYEEEQKEVLELVRWLGDFAYYNICHVSLRT